MCIAIGTKVTAKVERLTKSENGETVDRLGQVARMAVAVRMEGQSGELIYCQSKQISDDLCGWPLVTLGKKEAELL